MKHVTTSTKLRPQLAQNFGDLGCQVECFFENFGDSDAKASCKDACTD